MTEASLSSVYTKARRHLARRDPILKPLISKVGTCTLTPGGEPFLILVRAIISQMISTKAANNIFSRVETAAGEEGVIPRRLLDLGEEKIREQGLSTTKAKAILDLADRTLDGRLPLDRLSDLSDTDIYASLTAVRGIGPWTAEMFLIFGLGRLDILPVADFGLRAGVKEVYQLEELPTPAKLRELATLWQPYRSIATWYIWRGKGDVPQS